MNTSELIERYPLLKLFALPIVLGVLGLICLGYGLMVLSRPQDNSKDILFEAASDVSPLAQEAKTKQITVDVEGAVVKPGVYKLKSDSRIQDALIAAGGMSAGADRDKIAKSLNLAAKLQDGAKIFIPEEGEELAASPLRQGSAGQGGSMILGEATDLININDATSSQLEDLPGIGPTTAGKIIGSRPYASIEELVSKKIVGQKVFDQIKDKITAY